MLRGVAAGGVLAALGLPMARAAERSAPRVVVVGGGFAGASCARALKSNDRALQVTLVEPNAKYIACPFSNAVVAGLRTLKSQTFGYGRVRAAGVKVVHQRVTAVDTQQRSVRLDDGKQLCGMVSIGDVVKTRIAETVSEAAALRDYISATV